ncbi:MAG: hypothetical protein ACOCRK_03405 [bacterium]
MENRSFNKLLDDYKDASVEEKIDIYCSTTNLTEDQYMVLLRNFPMNQIGKLEKALA